jgi:hypothetical protein
LVFSQLGFGLNGFNQCVKLWVVLKKTVALSQLDINMTESIPTMISDSGIQSSGFSQLGLGQKGLTQCVMFFTNTIEVVH